MDNSFTQNSEWIIPTLHESDVNFIDFNHHDGALDYSSVDGGPKELNWFNRLVYSK